jgi:DNA-binding NarL/FixJ family response regulator
LESDDQRAPKILIGDFGAIGGLGLREFLDDEGFTVVTNGATANEVLESLDDGEADVDVVVLDRHMPGVAGATERIGREHPDVKVILCSLDEPTMHVFPAWGGVSYESPLDADRLVLAVRGSE